MEGVKNAELALPSTKKKAGKKRKQRSASAYEEEEESPEFSGEPCKISHFDQSKLMIQRTSVELEENSPWKNLHLVLLLQNQNIDLLEKVDKAFDYVKSSSTKEIDYINQPSQVLSTSRTLVFLNGWVQSVLISSGKKMKLEENKLAFGTLGSYLDIRCWKILHFCLEKAKNLHLSLTCSRDFLLVIRWIAMDASSCISNVLCEATLSGKRVDFYDVVLLCISLVFTFHGGVANENLDLWISLLCEVLELVLKIVEVQLDHIQLLNVIFKLLCYLLEPFAKFLRVQPTRKSGFHDFVDKLLEPLLHLLYVARNSSRDTITEWTAYVHKLVEEVLAQGLFHPSHIDGFLILNNLDKYKSCTDVPLKEEKMVNRSYHRHLFDKVEKIVANKNGLSLLGLGYLLQLFANSIVKHRATLVNGGGSGQSIISSRNHVADELSQSRMLVSEKMPRKHNIDAELRKSIFSFFVQIIEYLLTDVNNYLESSEEVISLLPNFSNILRCINNLLARFMFEKLYLRTEDASEGAFRNFLRIIYDTVISMSTKISYIKISSQSLDEKSIRVVISVEKELIVIVHHLLEIEYEVVGDDLEKLWAMAFSSLACCYSAVNVLDQPVVLSEILSFSCRLIDIYSELRQVNSSIFALCRALRHSGSLFMGTEACYSSFTNSLSMLLCSSEFRLSLSKAIKAIPEGQAAGCISRLVSDIKESLEWIKCNSQFESKGDTTKSNPRSCDSVDINLQAEILGKALCEVYTVILDSIIITSGNSSLVGASLKNLMGVIGSYLSNIVSIQPDSTLEFCTVVNARILSKGNACENVPMCWILLLFFRLLLSCRSVSRQAISAMPPNASRKMSEAIGDPFTAWSGKDWLEVPRSGEGFFSWISRSSPSLLDLLSSNLDIYFQNSAALCPPLVYTSIAMVLQRLVDLNRLIKSFEYTLLWNRTRNRVTLNNDTNFRKWQKSCSLITSFRYMKLWNQTHSVCNKRIRRWKKCISHMRKEAAGLTKFMMESFSSVIDDRISASSPDDGIGETFIQGLYNKDEPNFPVASLDKKSLPYALWWIICENVEVWCSYAAKKDLKNLLTLLIQASVSSVSDCANRFRTFNHNSGHLKKVTPYQIALRFMRNIISIEQKFVHRYMESRFCRMLHKSVLSIFGSSVIDLSKSPDWSEVIFEIENFSDMQSDALPWINRSMTRADRCDDQTKFASCQFLLTFLMQMPEEYLSSKSSSLYIASILNLERLLVCSLLGLYSASCSDVHGMFQLFVSCRKTLNMLIAASCKENENEGQFSSSSGLLDYPFPLTWLLKSLSATVGFRSSLPDDIPFEAKVPIFSLIDYTSNAVKTASQNQFEREINFISFARKHSKGRKILAPETEGANLEDSNLQVNSENLEACSSVLQLTETLMNHMQTIHTTFMDASRHKKMKGSTEFQEFYSLSSVISCFQGLLWGLASALGETDTISINFRVKFSCYNTELLARMNSCIDAFLKFLSLFLRELFLKDDLTLKGSVSDCNGLGAGEPLSGDRNDFYDTPCEGDMEHTGEMTKNASFKKNTLPAIRDLEACLKEVQGDGVQLKESLLLDCLRGQNAEMAFILQQLFIAYSAFMRLSLQIELASVSWSLFPAMLGISRFVLWEFSAFEEMPHQSALFCLDGVLKFLEELGNCFPQFNPSFSRDFYAKLIDLHLKAIGKCISLQGKDAKLSSLETGSHTYMLANQGESYFPLGRTHLGYLKARLRLSFTTYVRRASELHLLSAIQALERALVGVQEGLMTNYDISFGNSEGGKISPLVAAGIECVDLILECVSGQKRLNMIKRHIQAVVASIFNVILHLQAPNIFYGQADAVYSYEYPDSGSVILMCIEVLTKIAAKPAFFHMHTCHIAQSLRVPAPLFQYFLQLQISEAPLRASSGSHANNSTIDQKFAIGLYSACCRLLCTTLKHHKSETWQCISLLEDSVSALLQCLEIVKVDLFPGKHAFAWEVQGAVKCASNLRRIYEEVRQQKDVFGQCSIQLLSRYIWVYCGFGQAGSDIIREVDEALRPGLYALIDCCSANDLQLLHTQFGEGPCRSTLAALQHDYKINFQFGGKV